MSHLQNARLAHKAAHNPTVPAKTTKPATIADCIKSGHLVALKPVTIAVTRPETFNGLTETQEIERGQMLVALMNLRQVGKFTPPRYNTSHGTKTALGLFRTIENIVKHGN